MTILALALLIIGAVITYGSRFIFENVIKKEYGDKEIASLKTIGLFIALVGAVIIFVIK